MNSSVAKCPYPAKAGTPVWDLARWYPLQGHWTEEEYLSLDRGENALVEFTDGYLEVLPVPTKQHQRIVKHLLRALLAFADPQLGEVFFAPLPFKLRKGMWREPDLLFIKKENRTDAEYPSRIDLAIEVVSAGTTARQRDYLRKRREYAQFDVAEYWIVDPQTEKITVLTLEGRKYVEHGVFKKSQRATSVLLKGFHVDVTEALRAN
ncbi:MAG TPA: Uma2 family endonuclease [Planctomycetota bacterium]|jgi:Uma2 family endonuclease